MVGGIAGNRWEEVEGLGMEGEVCRGGLVMEGSDMETMVAPLRSFLLPFGFKVPDKIRWVWTDCQELRALQTDADLPPDDFIDDFLRYCYPVYYHEGAYHLLRRMTKPTFIAYAVVQLAAGDLPGRDALPDLAGKSPLPTFRPGCFHRLSHALPRPLGHDL